MKASRLAPRALPGAALVLLVVCLIAPGAALAQQRPPERQIRTYIPPDQLVSFLPSTPFDQFIEFLNPIFERVTKKTIVDPESVPGPIGIAIAGMHFLDAFELVLEYNGLVYRETDRFFIVEDAPADAVVSPTGAPAGPMASRAAGGAAAGPATLDTREIRINAILFDFNHTRARDIGLNWNTFFGDGTTSGGSGGTGSGTGGTGGRGSQDQARFYLRTDEIFESVDDYIVAPDVIGFDQLTQFFRLLENEGVGETVANPSVTVQSGQQGRIQIGSDVPLNVRDFAGNTVTSFISTGIIINVTPTLITEALADTFGAPTMNFVHLNVLVENSSSRPTASGPAIDKSTANTQILLLDGEQTIIGGLYSTDESVERRGIPILKDLPGWFFGLRYIFGTTVTSVNQNEMLIVLQAEVVDPLQARAGRAFEERLLEKQRALVKEAIRRVDEETSKDIQFPGEKN